MSINVIVLFKVKFCIAYTDSIDYDVIVRMIVRRMTEFMLRL